MPRKPAPPQPDSTYDVAVALAQAIEQRDRYDKQRQYYDKHIEDAAAELSTALTLTGQDQVIVPGFRFGIDAHHRTINVLRVKS